MKKEAIRMRSVVQIGQAALQKMAFQSSDFGRSFLMIYSGKQEMPSSCLMSSKITSRISLYSILQMNNFIIY